MSVVVGQKYGKLTVEALVVHGNANQRKWLCKCDCGGMKVTSEDNLQRRHCRSCGCLYKNNGGSKKKNIYLGSDSRLYSVWAGMKSRCFNPNSPNFYLYGGRGITVCDEWMHYGNFKKWAIETGYDRKHDDRISIDRIDVNGNYEPSNCRWATVKEQMNNRRTNTVIEYKGLKKSLSQWAEYLGINYSTFMSRYERGWQMDRIVSQPVRKRETTERSEKPCP